jgi:hypothetical protein
MGCDIHLYREELVDGKWKALDEWIKDPESKGQVLYVPWEKQIYSSRNYTLFGMLAGVRSSNPSMFEVHGFPCDASKEVDDCFESWKEDAHSASYITYKDIAEFLETKPTYLDDFYMKQSDYDELQHSIDDGDPDWDILDREKDYDDDDGERFDVEVPIKYVVGNFFEDILGNIHENGRIVFWFDN